MIIVIEGNIASGKTTALRFCAEFLEKQGFKVDVKNEPVATWQNFHGTNMLEEYLKNPQENAYSFHSLCLGTMAELFPKANSLGPDDIVLMDRSIFSIRFVFIQHFYDRKILNDVQFHILDSLFNSLVKQLPPVDQFIYLKSDPDKCLSRIKKRGRPEESNIKVDWLEALDGRHFNMLQHADSYLRKNTSAKITIVDGNAPEEDVFAQLSNILPKR